MGQRDALIPDRRLSLLGNPLGPISDRNFFFAPQWEEEGWAQLTILWGRVSRDETHVPV